MRNPSIQDWGKRYLRKPSRSTDPFSALHPRRVFNFHPPTSPWTLTCACTGKHYENQSQVDTYKWDHNDVVLQLNVHHQDCYAHMSCCSVAEVGYRGRTIRLPCAVSAFANTPHGRVIPGLQHVIAASKSFTMLGYHTFSRTVRGFGRENLESDFYWGGYVLQIWACSIGISGRCVLSSMYWIPMHKLSDPISQYGEVAIVMLTSCSHDSGSD